MNWILIKDKVITLFFWAAITFEVIAVWNLFEGMYSRGKKLLKKKKGVKI